MVTLQTGLAFAEPMFSLLRTLQTVVAFVEERYHLVLPSGIKSALVKLLRESDFLKKKPKHSTSRHEEVQK